MTGQGMEHLSLEGYHKKHRLEAARSTCSGQKSIQECAGWAAAMQHDGAGRKAEAERICRKSHLPSLLPAGHLLEVTAESQQPGAIRGYEARAQLSCRESHYPHSKEHPL